MDIKRTIELLACLLSICMAATAAAGDLGKNFEASMVVTGTITVNPDGRVANYTLDKPDKLPQPVKDIIKQIIGAWNFRPVFDHGQPVRATSKMNLRVVATDEGDGTYRNLHVRGVTFKDRGTTRTTSVTFGETKLPQYPSGAIRVEVSAIAYVVLEIGHDGHVQQAVAEQVNVRARGHEWLMRAARDAFAEAALDAARKWTFNVSPTGSDANADHWTVRVPIDFVIPGGKQMEGPPGYGEWDDYTPGPVQPVPWEQQQMAAHDIDALPNGEAYLQDKRFALLTPLNG